MLIVVSFLVIYDHIIYMTVRVHLEECMVCEYT